MGRCPVSTCFGPYSAGFLNWLCTCTCVSALFRLTKTPFEPFLCVCVHLLLEMLFMQISEIVGGVEKLVHMRLVPRKCLIYTCRTCVHSTVHPFLYIVPKQMPRTFLKNTFRMNFRCVLYTRLSGLKSLDSLLEVN